MTKYIFVTGGVVSGLGKGITAASLGRLLKARGLKIAAQKLDPYINVDPDTMSPYQHGEVYITEDGAETDLPLEDLWELIGSQGYCSACFSGNYPTSIPTVPERIRLSANRQSV